MKMLDGEHNDGIGVGKYSHGAIIESLNSGSVPHEAAKLHGFL